MLAVLLALSSVQNVFAATEIAYDDGTSWGIASSTYLGVRFTAPWSYARLVQIRLVPPGSYAYTVYITQSDHVTIITSFPVSTIINVWNTFSVPGGGVTVPNEFYIVIKSEAFTVLYNDKANNYGRSYSGGTLAGMSQFPGGDFLLRAYVESASSVGGIALPTNSLTVLAPFLIMIGLVTIAAIVFVAKRR